LPAPDSAILLLLAAIHRRRGARGESSGRSLDVAAWDALSDAAAAENLRKAARTG